MQVTVRVHAELQRHTGGKGLFQLEVAPGATAAQVIDLLGVPANEVYAVVVDRKTASESTPLPDGAHVDLIPPLGGGV